MAYFHKYTRLQDDKFWDKFKKTILATSSLFDISQIYGADQFDFWTSQLLTVSKGKGFIIKIAHIFVSLMYTYFYIYIYTFRFIHSHIHTFIYVDLHTYIFVSFL